ncbi:MAG: hypothetical protein ACTSX4_14045 [Candidatus Helarchaeota archaeon]
MGLEKLLKIIPGYHGYKNKEERRETDELVRKKAMRELEGAENKLIEALEPAVDSGDKKLMSLLEKARGDIRIFVTKLKNAEHGYKPGWNLVSIREKEIEKAIEIDGEIVLESIEMNKMAEDIADKALMGEDIVSKVRDLTKRLNEIKKLFDDRVDIITGTQKIMDIK